MGFGGLVGLGLFAGRAILGGFRWLPARIAFVWGWHNMLFHISGCFVWVGMWVGF